MTTTLQKLANATVTKAQCGGHKKAARNDAARKRLAEELRKSGETVPTDDELYKLGEFNGDGAC